jgi:DnaJ-class molecular chaperone
MDQVQRHRVVRDTSTACPRCCGKGEVWHDEHGYMRLRACPQCDGFGRAANGADIGDALGEVTP